LITHVCCNLSLRCSFIFTRSNKSLSKTGFLYAVPLLSVLFVVNWKAAPTFISTAFADGSSSVDGCPTPTHGTRLLSRLPAAVQRAGICHSVPAHWTIGISTSPADCSHDIAQRPAWMQAAVTYVHDK